MTVHFVNLVSWKFFIGKDLESSILFCDSLTLKILLFFFGIKLNQVSGVQYSKSIKDLKSLGIMGSIHSGKNNSFQLPYWSKMEDVCLSNDMLDFINKYDNIAIGISSPKQDQLSFLINKQFPNKRVFCLGAALGDVKKISIMGKLGLMWFGFLIQEPKRTTIKLKITIKNFFEIIFVKRLKEDFINVSKNFKRFGEELKRLAH